MRIEPIIYYDWQQLHLEEKVERLSDKMDEIIKFLNKGDDES